MMTKEQKKNYVEEMKKVFSSNEAVMIAHYKGLNVKQLDQIRDEMRKKIEIIIKPRRKADLSQIISDNTKLKNFLRWKPKYNNLKLMVNSCIKWERKLS